MAAPNSSIALPPRLPPAGLIVDYGKPAPASSNPMPTERRALYARRITAAHRDRGVKLSRAA